MLLLSVNKFHLFIITICIQPFSNRHKTKRRGELSKRLRIIRFEDIEEIGGLNQQLLINGRMSNI